MSEVQERDYGTMVRSALPATKCHRFEGIIWSVLAGLCCVGTAVTTKYLEAFSVTEICIYQFAAMSLFCLPMVALNERTLPKTNRTILSLWIFLGALSVGFGLTRVAAFQMLPLGDAGVIVFSTPVLTAVLTRLFLKEKITRLTLISLLMSLVGIILTVKLPKILSSIESLNKMKTNEHLIGCTFAFTSVILAAAWIVLLRKLRNVSPAINVLAMSTLGLLLSIAAAFGFKDFDLPTCGMTSWWLMANSVCFFLTTILFGKALQKEEATIVATVVRSVDIALSFVFQVWLFKESVDVYSITGAVLVTGSGLIMPYQRWMETLPDDSKCKPSFLLK